MSEFPIPISGSGSGIASLSKQTLDDLKKSGLSDATIIRSKIVDDSSGNKDAVRILRNAGVGHGEGYIIPYVGYIDSRGEAILQTTTGPHYRIKLFEGNIKYVQRAGTGNHVYIPPTLPLNWATSGTPLIITEGEKKSLKAVQEGFNCIAVGGVWSWKNRTFSMPADQVTRTESVIKPQQPSSTSAERITVRVDNYYDAKVIGDGVAPEMALIPWDDREVVILFDTDSREVSRIAVQQAAFELGMYLEEQGARVVQIKLPLDSTRDGGKIGLDDFLMADASNVEWLRGQIEGHRNSFPSPANARRFVQIQLNSKDVNRHKPNWSAAKAIMAAIDDAGVRYRDTQGFNYYFDNQTLTLHKFTFAEIAGSSFGDLLVAKFGLSNASRAVMLNLEGMYTGRGCEFVTPHKVISHSDTAIYYQLSNSRIAKVEAKEISVVNNGTDGQLFLPVEGDIPIDEQQIVGLTPALGGQGKKLFRPRWLKVLETVNLQPIGELDIGDSRKLLTCIMYMSPWLLRWRGTQLPIEIAVAEPNSGKTFLYNLRRGILTGNPSLQGMPNDFRAFVSSVQNASGLWVCDNLGHTNREYWERLNDELARLVTEPSPTIELRQLYTTSNVARIPVQCTFAVTSIRNPLTKPDLVQRSIVFELAAIPMGKRNSNWYTQLLGERTEFIAEHLNVLHQFMKLAEEEWEPNYLSSYRLVNFEQSLRLVGKVLGFDSESMGRIVLALPKLVSSIIEDVDVVIQGLGEFGRLRPGSTVQVSEVVTWAMSDMLETYSGNHTLTNVIRLGKYIKSHASDIEMITGIKYERRHNTTWLTIPKS